MCTMYERIDKLCKEKNISVSAMCRDLRINRSTLSELNKGRTKSLSADNVSKVADYFGVSEKYLLGLTDNCEDNIKVYDEHDNIVVIDDETRDIIDTLRTNPEMKILFSVSKKATKEDILKAVKIIEALKGDE